ncbi:MAG: glucosamine-6-phosphate deaminase [Ruminococcus sp.]|jgi:glucosamine-6-phosphate deaminase|nr:glucosamine-6-phosphate deaminase [Ruminococcus sp.]
MKLIITENYEQSAELAAQMMLDVVTEKADALLGLATGTTPVPVYRYMVEAVQQKKTDFGRVRTINLDEYIGLDGEDSNSYLYFMRKHLLDACQIPPERVMIPNGMADTQAELDRMNAFADANPIDVQLLSVGANGHIGFNEPSDVFYDRYHAVKLTQKTRESNSRLFSSIEEVPTEAITMGTGGIMRAKKIVFLATGEEKLDAMKKILEDGEVTPDCQGTILKFHQDCTLFLDKGMADQIRPAPYVEVRRV